MQAGIFWIVAVMRIVKMVFRLFRVKEGKEKKGGDWWRFFFFCTFIKCTSSCVPVFVAALIHFWHLPPLIITKQYAIVGVNAEVFTRWRYCCIAAHSCVRARLWWDIAASLSGPHRRSRCHGDRIGALTIRLAQKAGKFLTFTLKTTAIFLQTASPTAKQKHREWKETAERLDEFFSVLKFQRFILEGKAI